MPHSTRQAATAAAPSASAITLLRTHSLATLAHKELERMILAGDLPVGGKLNEATVAAQLGVSRGPIREAFRALEESGLVRVEKNRGVFVRQISVEEADEIYDVRASLDEMIGRRVAELASADQLAQLRALIGRMEAAAAARNTGDYHVANLAFHDALAQRDDFALLDYQRRAGAATSVATPDHYFPLLYALGASDARVAPETIYAGFQSGTISMRCVQFGATPA